MTIIYWLPLMNFLLGFFLSYAIGSFIVFKGKQRLYYYMVDLKKSPLLELRIREMIAHAEVEHEVEQFLEKQVDDFVGLIKKQIPMAGTFLQGSLLEKLKGMAQGEIGKMLPPLKEKIEQKVIASFRKGTWMNAFLTDETFTKEIALLALLGGAAGGTLGILNLLVFLRQ